MIKRILYILLGFAICLVTICTLFVFCVLHSDKTDPVEKDIDRIKNINNVINVFEDELSDTGIDENMIDNIVAKLEELNKETNCAITFEIRNNANPILYTKISLPVEEEFFSNVEVGDTITKERLQKIEYLNQFNQDSFDNWTIVVKDKIVRE